jgi:hypothetical protein
MSICADSSRPHYSETGRIRAIMHHVQGEKGGQTSIAPSKKAVIRLARAGWLSRGQSDWMANYAERHRAELRVGTAILKGRPIFR